MIRKISPGEGGGTQKYLQVLRAGVLARSPVGDGVTRRHAGEFKDVSVGLVLDAGAADALVPGAWRTVGETREQTEAGEFRVGVTGR